MFLITLLHLLGLIDLVEEDAKELKNVVNNVNNQMKEGFDETRGKHILLASLVKFIH